MAEAVSIDHLVERQQRLPLLTADLPGTGGLIKQRSEDFVVEEVPLYDPCGEGPHLYVTLERQEWTTAQVAARLATLFGVSRQDLGWAGLKDKLAVATQTFSIPWPLAQPIEDVSGRIEAETPFRVIRSARHGNKLKTGHLRGNRFTMLLRDTGPDALARALAVAAVLQQRGVPNFFGEQRFGYGFGNIGDGAAILLQGRRVSPAKRRLLVSAYQSAVFNWWLCERIERFGFDRLLDGDIAKKRDSGALFDVVDADLEAPRLRAGAIHYTGPIAGHKMRRPSLLPAALEQELIEAAGLTAARLKRARASGDRRAARVFPEELTVRVEDAGLQLRFMLPKGAFATIVAREFTRSDRSATSPFDP